MRTKILILASWILLSSVPASSATIADTKSVLAVFVHWKPFGYIENGKAIGFELDIFSAVMQRMGVRVKYREMPWQRCLYMVEHGASDAVISALKKPERQKYMYYPEANISVNQTALFCSIDSDVKFTGSYKDLKPYIIGVTRGFRYSEGFDKANYLKKDENTRTEDIVGKLVNSRIDLGIGNLIVIRTVAGNMGVQHKIKFLMPLVHSSELYVGFSKKRVSPDFVRRFSQQLTDFKKTAEYRQILDKYGVIYPE